jgi:hypothetical protein
MIPIAPYLVFPNLILCLRVTLGLAVFIILVFSHSVPVAGTSRWAPGFLGWRPSARAGVSLGTGAPIRVAPGVEV